MRPARKRAPAPRLAREDRIDAILVAARDLFCEKGYEAVAMAEIAQRIGVVEGLLYKYFATKRELLLKVLEQWYDEMFGDYARDLAGVRGHRARLRLLVWRHLRTVRDYPLLCRLMFREVRREEDYRGTILHAKNRRYTQLLTDVIAEGIAAGEFRDDVPPTLLRDLIYGGIEHSAWNYMVDTVARKRGRGRGPLDIDALADQITGIVCDGIVRDRTGELEREVQRLTAVAARIERAVSGPEATHKLRAAGAA